MNDSQSKRSRHACRSMMPFIVGMAIGWIFPSDAAEDAAAVFDDPPLVQIHPVTKLCAEPIIDGDLDKAWESVPEEPLRYQFDVMIPKPAAILTTMRLGYNDDALFLFVRCDSPHMDKLATKHTVRDDANAWEDDCLEIYFDRLNTGVSFNKFIVTAANTVVDMWVPDGQRQDYSWGPGTWRSAVRRDAQSWSVEARFPWVDFGVAAPAAGDLWGFALIRYAFASENCGVTSAAGASFFSPSYFGYLFFGDDPVSFLPKLAPVINQTKGQEWMCMGNSEILKYDNGQISQNPYSAWMESALETAQKRLKEAQVISNACKDAVLVQANAKGLASAAEALVKAQTEWGRRPADPLVITGLRAEAKQAFGSMDKLVWQFKINELQRQYGNPGSAPK